MATAQILQEYLVALGFKIDQKTLSKFDASLAKVAKGAIAFGVVLGGVAAATTKLVDTVSDELGDLYWASVRMRTGVAAIRDFQLGISKAGGTAEGARNSLEGLARFMRTQPFAEGMLNNLGVKTRDANGNLRDTLSILKDFAKLPIPYWLKVRFAEKFGADEQTLLALQTTAGDTGDAMSKMYAMMGMNADQAAKQSAEYNNTMADFHALLSIIGESIAVNVLPLFIALGKAAVYIVRGFGALAQVTHGLVTPLTIIGAIAAGLAIAFGSIPMLIVAVGAAAIFVANNWSRMYNTIKPGLVWLENAYNRMAKLYNKVAAKAGLPQLGLIDTTEKPAPHDGARPDTMPDYKELMKNFGPNSMPGGTSREQAAGRADKQVTGQALAFFQKMGWTADQAAGIVSNLIYEGGLRANTVGDNGAAYGTAQWHKDRQDAFAKWAGHSIKLSTIQEQLAFVNHELTNGAYAVAGRALRATQGARAASAVVARQYERPSAGALAGSLGRRGDIASALAGPGGTTNKLANGGTGNRTIIIQSKTDIKVEGNKDPHSTARAVGNEQTRVNSDVARNFAGASS